MGYAEGTSVGVDRSKSEIENVLRRYGAEQFISAWKDGHAMIGFRMSGRMVRFVLPIPEVASFKEIHGKTWRGREYTRRRSDSAALEAAEQELRRRFRALNLVIKAKLEAVETGITQFEEEFLAHIVLPGNMTVWEKARPEIAKAYEVGKAPEMLLGFGSGK